MPVSKNYDFYQAVIHFLTSTNGRNGVIRLAIYFIFVATLAVLMAVAIKICEAATCFLGSSKTFPTAFKIPKIASWRVFIWFCSGDVTMVGWTTTETFKFIELYQKESCIWNPTNKFHKDKIKVNDAWLRIADDMGASVNELKRKKETLLAAFRLNRKKVLASRKSGADEDEVFKPVWVYYDALAAFMTDVYECKYLDTSEEYVQDEDPLVEVESPHASSTHLSSESKKRPAEDDCDLYGRLLAKKLRQYTELDRLDLMYEIDGILLKKRRLLYSSS